MYPETVASNAKAIHRRDNRGQCFRENHFFEQTADVFRARGDLNGIVNFDLPSCIDDEAYAHDILKVSQGQTVYRTEYTFNNPNVVPKQLEFRPAPIVVVEGIFVFYFEEVARLLDLKVYIDAKEHIKLQRRIVRDRIERGYDLEDVLYRYTEHVAPTYEKYIAPYKNDADIIIPNNNHFERGLEVITTFLNAKIKA